MTCYLFVEVLASANMAMWLRQPCKQHQSLQQLSNHAEVCCWLCQATVSSTAQVVNKTEVTRLGDIGVPFFGINLSVGLSLALPGFQTDMAKGLLNNMPQGVITLVGAKSPSDAVQARAAGADAILLKKQMLTVKGQSRQDVRQLIEQLKYSMSGDD